MHHRRRLRGPRRLRLDQGMQAGRLGTGGGLAAANKLDVLRFSQHRQFADTLTRVLADRLQQVAPVCRQTLHRRSLEQAGRVDQRRAQRITAFIGIQSQVELRRRARPLQRLHSQPRQLQSLALTRVLVVVHHLEQWAVAQTPLRLQRLYQLLERQVLMGLRFQCGTFDLLQQDVETGLQVEVGLQHLGIDEEADQTLGLYPGAVGDRYPNADFRLPAVAMQQGLETGQQQHEQGHALLLRQLFQRATQVFAQLHLQAVAGRTLYARPRPVGRQFQHRLLAAQLLPPVGQLALTLAGFHPAALPQGIVGVLDRQRLQLHGAAFTVAGVELHKLFHHDRRRPTIGDDVVQGHHQHLFLGGQAQQQDP